MRIGRNQSLFQCPLLSSKLNKISLSHHHLIKIFIKKLRTNFETDLLSLNSFTTENEDLLGKSKNFNKAVNAINKIKNPESEFSTEFDYNSEKKLQSIFKKKSRK